MGARSITKLFTTRRCGDKSEKKTLKRWRGSRLDTHLCDLLLRCSVRGFIYFFICWPNSLVTVVEADWQVVAGVLHLCSPSLPLCVLVRLLLCCEIRNVTKNKACWLTHMMTFAYLKGKPGPPNIHSYVLGDKPTCSQNKCPHSWKPGIKSKSIILPVTSDAVMWPIQPR